MRRAARRHANPLRPARTPQHWLRRADRAHLMETIGTASSAPSEEQVLCVVSLADMAMLGSAPSSAKLKDYLGVFGPPPPEVRRKGDEWSQMMLAQTCRPCSEPEAPQAICCTFYEPTEHAAVIIGLVAAPCGPSEGSTSHQVRAVWSISLSGLGGSPRSRGGGSRRRRQRSIHN